MKKKVTSIISAAACAAAVLGTVPFAASADNLVYGTMNIPYSEFYANEGIGYEVDAVSSATTTKWASNQDGGLVQGTFNEANADGSGKILGVVYPVAISQEDLNALGDNNYSFTALDSEPAAYKTVTVENGNASFSSVVDNEIENGKTTLTVETTSVWGDYCVTIDNLTYARGDSESSIGKLYGCIVTDTNGNNYAMRHLENIWKNELGINVLAGADMHGSQLSYENFVGLNGASIDKITYITQNGYYVYDVDPDAYLAKKITGGVTIDDADLSAGKTTITTDLPSDYNAEYTLQGLEGSVSGNVLSYSGAEAGSYSVTVSDKNGVYESFTVSFVLNTDAMPATYSNGAIVKAEGADDSDFANFLKNISKVSVNGNEYAASGRGSVKIIGDDGKIDLTANSRGENVFDGSGNYNVVITATGYTNSLEFIMGESEEQPSSTTASSSDNKQTSTTTVGSSKTTNSSNTNSSKTTNSPKTGVSGVAIPVVLLAAATTAAVVTNKKKNK